MLSISALVKRGAFSSDNPQSSDGIFGFHCDTGDGVDELAIALSPTDFSEVEFIR